MDTSSHAASTTSSSSSEVSEKLIQLSERQLWNLLTALMRNLSSPSSSLEQPPHLTQTTYSITSTVNMTSTTSTASTDDRTTMIAFVLVFFIWYGGVIFVCLIGFGVYKKPSSYEVYRKFVERRDIREQMKQMKDEERKQRQMRRQNSSLSMYSSNSADVANGQIKTRGIRSFPSAIGIVSTRVNEEEEDGLLNADTSPTSENLTPNTSLLLTPSAVHSNGGTTVVFET